MRHIITHRAGAPGYIDAHQRGTVDIWHDQRRYIYKSAPPKAAREFIDRAWQQENITITGRHPNYFLESV